MDKVGKQICSIYIYEAAKNGQILRKPYDYKRKTLDIGMIMSISIYQSCAKEPQRTGQIQSQKRKESLYVS